MANTGRSYEQIDEMTVFDARMIFDYWSKHPPSNEVLAAVYMKREEKPSGSPRINEKDPSGIGGLMAQFPGGFMREG